MVEYLFDEKRKVICNGIYSMENDSIKERYFIVNRFKSKSKVLLIDLMN